jgi:hypothetical protein
VIRAQPARRPRRSAPLLAATVVALLAAACSTLSPSPGPTAGPTAGSSAGATPAQTTDLTTVRAYFFVGSFTASGGLVPVERQVPRLEPAGAAQRGAIGALLAGPDTAELGASPALFTTMPEGTRLLDLAFEGTVATVDLSGEFAGGGSASARARLAQVVYTMTQFDGTTAVRFKVDGKPVTAFSDAGIDLSSPVDRTFFKDQVPAIFVDGPVWGGRLANPARIVGLADVFEATFRARIVDAAGHQLADVQVMATCGSGCLGTFDETIPYTAPVAGPGVLQVYEPSAVDGSPTNITEYPVILSP